MIGIVDYGVGNLASAKKALVAAGADAELVRAPERIASADALVLPGVGNFGHCARELRRLGLAEPVVAAYRRGAPLLGICVGMQLRHEGLGLLPGTVVRLRWVSWVLLAALEELVPADLRDPRSTSPDRIPGSRMSAREITSTSCTATCRSRGVRSPRSEANIKS